MSISSKRATMGAVTCAFAMVCVLSALAREGGARDGSPADGGKAHAKFADAKDGGYELATPEVTLAVSRDGTIALSPRSTDAELRVGMSAVALRSGPATFDLESRTLSIVQKGAYRLELNRGEVTEVYEPRAQGLEQLFIVHTLPDTGNGDLTIDLRLTTSLEGVLVGVDGRDGVAFMLQGRTVLRYGGATAFDAEGRRTSARMALVDGVCRIVVDGAWAASATLPITIDPLIGTASDVSTSTNPEGNVDIAHNEFNDQYPVVWDEVIRPGERRIMFRRYSAASGTATAAVVIHDVVGTDSSEPQVAWLAGSTTGNNKYLVAWHNRAQNRLEGRVITGPTATTPTIGGQLTLVAPVGETLTAFALSGRQTTATDLTFQQWLVFYEVAVGADRDLKVQRLDNVGAPTGGVLPVAVDPNVISRQPTVNKFARTTTSWNLAWSEQVSQGSSDFDIKGCTLTQGNAGTLGTIAAIISTPDVEQNPSIAGFTSPIFMAWERVEAGTGRRDVRVAVLNAATAGITIEAGTSVSDVPGSTGFDNRAPAASSGAQSAGSTPTDKAHVYLVAFERGPIGGGASNIFQVMYDADGNILDPLTQITADDVSTAPAAMARSSNTTATFQGVRESLVGWQRAVAPAESNVTVQRAGSNAPRAIGVRNASGTSTTTVIPSGSTDPQQDDLLYFGAVSTTSTTLISATIFVRNDGLSDLTVNLPTSTNTTDFVLSTTGFPTTLTSGTTATFSIGFDPQTVGVKVSTITITHNGTFASANPYTFEVKGIGVNGPPPAHIETVAPDVEIPDNQGTTGQIVRSTIFVPDRGTVITVRSTINITHNDTRDVIVFLVGPNGASIELTSGNPSTANLAASSYVNYVNTTFDETATFDVDAAAPNKPVGPFTGSFRPEEATLFTEFHGIPAVGPWTLEVRDSSNRAFGGRLVSWSLAVDVAPNGPTVAGVSVREGTASGATVLHQANATGTTRDFGVREVTQAALRREFVLVNNGNASLTLSAPTSSNPAEFTLTTPGFTPTLAPGASLTLLVDCAPAQAGTVTATISFTHNASGIPSPFEIPLKAFGLTQPPTVGAFSAGGMPLNLNDNSAATSQIFVPLGGEVLAVTVTVHVEHPDSDQIDMALISPDGRRIVLANDLTSSFVNAYDNTTFDDAAGISILSATPAFTATYRPTQPLATFFGGPVNGLWTLEVADDVVNLVGTLQSWSIQVTSTLAGPPIPTLEVTDGGGAVSADARASGDRDFGRRLQGTTSAPIAMRAANTGTAPLTIGSISIVGSTPSDFVLSLPQGLTFPVTVSSGALIDFTVAFAPQSEGRKEALIEITHDGTFFTRDPYYCEVRGTGLAQAAVSASSLDTPYGVGHLYPPAVSTINVGASGFVADVEVVVNIAHTATRSLMLFLIAPDGTRVELSTNNPFGFYVANYANTRFDDDALAPVNRASAPFAGTFSPDGRLSDLVGKPAAGAWRLEVSDIDADSHTGVLTSWTLDLVTSASPGGLLEVREGAIDGAIVRNQEPLAGHRRFGQTEAGGSSAPHLWYLKNRGVATLNTSSVAPSGPDAADFALDASGLPAQLTPGASGVIAVTFQPTTTGTKRAFLRFGHDASLATGAPFALEVSGEAVTAVASPHISAEVPLVVPNATGEPALSRVAVNLPGAVADLDVTVDIANNTVAQLDVFLIGPDGTSVKLAADLAGTVGYVDTVFDDQAAAALGSVSTGPRTGSFRPLEPLSTFNGRLAAGVWTLAVHDDAPTIQSTVRGFRLHVVTATASQGIEVRNATPAGLLLASGALRDLGAAVSGAPAEPVRLFVRNVGASTLTLQAPVRTGSTDFTIDVSGFSTTLAAGASTSFLVTFQPSALGRREAFVAIGHDAPGAATPYVIALGGVGISRRIQAEGPLPGLDYFAHAIFSAGLDLSIAVTTTGTVADVDVNVNIEHGQVDDLRFYLTGPDGTRVELSSANGEQEQHYDGTTLDDAALLSITEVRAPFVGRFRPEQPLAAFNGKGVAGAWTLHVEDLDGTSSPIVTGHINSWSLDFGVLDVPSAMLVVRDDASGEVLRNGALAAGSRDFQAQVVGSQTVASRVRVTNSGALAMALGVPVTSGPNAAEFSVDASQLPPSLAPGQSATFSVRFQPAALGARAATVSFTHDGLAGADSPFTLGLAGAGVAAISPTLTSTVLPAIPDWDVVATTGVAANAARSTVYCNAVGGVTDVDVTFSIDHPASGELDIFLLGPDGTLVELATDVTGTQPYRDTRLDDQAPGGVLITSRTGANSKTGTFIPEFALSAFNSRVAAGLWTLLVADDNEGSFTSAVNPTLGRITRFELTVQSTTASASLIEVREGSARGAVIAHQATPTLGRVFPATLIGAQSSPITIAINNAGAVPLTLTSIVSSSPSFVLGAAPSSPIASGETGLFTVTFAPPVASQTGLHAGTISITHGASGANPITCDVSGRAVAAAPQTFVSTGVPVTVAQFVSGSLPTGEVSLTVPQAGTILDVFPKVTARIGSTATPSFDLILVHPDGTEVCLTADDSGQEYVDTQLDDAAATPVGAVTSPTTGIFRPEQALATLFGRRAQGTWKLRLANRASGPGLIQKFELTIVLGPDTGVMEVQDAGTAGAVVTRNATAQGARHFNRQALAVPTVTQTYIVRNIGSANLTVAAPVKSGADLGDFSVAAPTFPTVLASGATASFTVTFTPGGIGPRSASLSFTQDSALDPSPFVFALAGEGVAGALGSPALLTSPDVPMLVPDAFTTSTTNAPPKVPPARLTVFSNLPGAVADVNVHLTIQHTTPTHLDVFLVHPDGTQVELFTDVSGTGQITGTILDAQGLTGIASSTAVSRTGAFVPEGDLGQFNNRPAAGAWTLLVFDDGQSVTGTAADFKLEIATAPTPTPLIEVRNAAGAIVPLAGTPIRVPNAGVIGTNTPVSFTIVNPGVVPLPITSITSSNPDYVVGSAPTSIPALSSASFTVTLDSQSGAGEKATTISLAHGASNAISPYFFDLVGRVFPTTPQHYSFAGPQFELPGYVYYEFPITVNQPGLVADVTCAFTVSQNGGSTSAMTYELVSPAGTRVLLSYNHGSHTNVTLDDRAAASISSGAAANSFRRPEEPLAAFRGQTAAGVWTLVVLQPFNISMNITQFDLTISSEAAFPLMTVVDRGGTAIAFDSAAQGRRDFGVQTIGGAAVPLEVVVRNDGFSNLTLGAASVTGTGFTVTQPASSVVAPGASTTFVVTFTPPSAGAFSGEVSFGHDAVLFTGQPFKFRVSGTGAATFPAADHPATVASMTIPPSNPAGARADVVVNRPGFVTDLRVKNVTIFHTAINQINLSLIAPDGTRVQLAPNASGDDYFATLFDDAAPTPIASGSAPFADPDGYRPVQPLANMNNHAARGAWSLLVVSTVGTVIGTVQSWTLELATTATAAPILIVTANDGQVFASGAAASGSRAFDTQLVAAGATAPVTINVTNAGGSTISLGAPALSGSHPAEFSLSAAGFPSTLAPGASGSFSVTFDPASAGVKQAAVNFAHAIVGLPSPFVVNFSGVGVTDRLVIAATDVPKTIFDEGLMVSRLTVPPPPSGGIFIVDINVSLDLLHSADIDLDIFLVSPSGTRIELSTDNGGEGNNYTGTIFDDSASTAIANLPSAFAPFTGAFRPEVALSTLAGQNAVGTWTLEITDDAERDFGTLTGWSLDIVYSTSELAGLRLNEGSTTGTQIPNGARGFQALNHGIAITGLPQVRTLFVTNTGTAPLTVQAPALSGPHASEFLVAGTFPMTIASGASGSFTVALDAVTEGDLSAILTFAHDADQLVANPFTFEARGRGVKVAPLVRTPVTLPVAIPDFVGTTSGVVDIPIDVSTRASVLFVNVRLSIAHTAGSDLDIFLLHPDGTIVELSTDNGGTGDNFTGTIFDDTVSRSITEGTAPFTGVFRPESPLAALNGKVTNGTWILRVIDDEANDVGSVTALELEIGVQPIGRIDVRQGANVVTQGQAATGAFAFGSRLVTAGPSAPVTVTIGNSGSSVLNVSGLTLTGAGASAFTLDTGAFNGSIPVGGNSSFTVAFTSAAAGAFTANVSLAHTDNSVVSPFLFGVSGEATEPRLEVSDGGVVIANGGTAGFESVPAGSASSVHTFTVRNSGTAPLLLGALTLGGVNPGDFFVDATGLAGTLAAGATKTFTVRFQPSVGVARSATFSFVHDGRNTATPYVATLSGLGTIAGSGSGRASSGGGGGCSASREAGDPSLIFVMALGLALLAVRRARTVRAAR